MGQVQVEYQGALRTESAMAKDESLKLETGKFVKVVDAIAERLIVVPLDIKRGRQLEFSRLNCSSVWGESSYRGVNWLNHGRRSASIDWYCIIGIRIISDNLRGNIQI